MRIPDERDTQRNVYFSSPGARQGLLTHISKLKLDG